MSPPLGVQNVAVDYISLDVQLYNVNTLKHTRLFRNEHFEMNTSNGPLLTGEIPPFHMYNLHVAKFMAGQPSPPPLTYHQK